MNITAIFHAVMDELPEQMLQAGRGNILATLFVKAGFVDTGVVVPDVCPADVIKAMTLYYPCEALNAGFPTAMTTQVFAPGVCREFLSGQHSHAFDDKSIGC